MMKNDFAYYLSRFLINYLPHERGYDEDTIDSYRYTFIILLRYLESTGLKAEKIKISDLTRNRIEAFLDYIENNRKNTVSTRNCRLAAIHTFFRYLQYEYPDYMDEYRKILDIPFKKAEKPNVSYLTVEEMTKLIEQIDVNTIHGYRDYMLILTLYETAVRVSELINIKIIDIRMSKPYVLKIIGKGNKPNSIPLSNIYIERLNKYLIMTGLDKQPKTSLLFTNASKNKLTRQGVNYIIEKYLKKAKEKYPDLYPKKVTAHIIRHTKAMHLLGDDVLLIYIRDILGHSSITTTEIYARTDSAKLRESLEKAYKDLSGDKEEPKWQNESILNWLNNFTK